MIDAEMKSIQSLSLSEDAPSMKDHFNSKLKSASENRGRQHIFTIMKNDVDCRSTIILAAVRRDSLFSNSNITSDGPSTALQMMFNGPKWLRDAVKFDDQESSITPESLLPLLNELLGTKFEDTAESKMYNVQNSDIDNMVREYMDSGYVHCGDINPAMAKFVASSESAWN